MNSGKFVKGVFRGSSCAYYKSQEFLYCIEVQANDGIGATAGRGTCRNCIKI